MFTQTTRFNDAPTMRPDDAAMTRPDLAVGLAADGGLAAGVRRARTRNRHRQPGPKLHRVLAMTLTASLHLVLIGLLLLPDTRPRLDRPEPPATRMADADNRLTLFVELDQPETALPPPKPAPPEPVAPAQRPPEPEPVAIEPVAPVPAPVALAPSDPTPTAESVPVAALEPARTDGLAATAASSAPVASESAPAAPAVAPEVTRRERDAYIKALMAALLQQRIYPAAARKAREQGVVHVRFTIDRDGQVLASKVQRGAGTLLDAAALEVLQRAAPLPAIPTSMGKQTLTITVPIEYSLTTR